MVSCFKKGRHNRLKRGDRTEQKMGLHDKKDIFVGCNKGIDSLGKRKKRCFLEGGREFFFQRRLRGNRRERGVCSERHEIFLN